MRSGEITNLATMTSLDEAWLAGQQPICTEDRPCPPARSMNSFQFFTPNIMYLIPRWGHNQAPYGNSQKSECGWVGVWFKILKKLLAKENAMTMEPFWAFQRLTVQTLFNVCET